SRIRHTMSDRYWSSDVCSSDLKPEPPAKVAKSVKEDELNTITLKPEAEKRINVQTKALERKPIHRSREYGGEVTVPVGRSIVVRSEERRVGKGERYVMW